MIQETRLKRYLTTSANCSLRVRFPGYISTLGRHFPLDGPPGPTRSLDFREVGISEFESTTKSMIVCTPLIACRKSSAADQLRSTEYKGDFGQEDLRMTFVVTIQGNSVGPITGDLIKDIEIQWYLDNVTGYTHLFIQHGNEIPTCLDLKIGG